MMSNREICQFYSQARDLRWAIRELAVKNGTTAENIRAILLRNGFAPPEMPPAPSVTPWPGADTFLAKTARLIELVEQGIPVPRIAEELGISYGQALTWVARICTLCEEYIASKSEDKQGGLPS